MREGKNRIARRNANTASNAMPRIRKGIEINQMIGQSINASSANGQQITHNNNQQINVNIPIPLYTQAIFILDTPQGKLDSVARNIYGLLADT